MGTADDPFDPQRPVRTVETVTPRPGFSVDTTDASAIRAVGSLRLTLDDAETHVDANGSARIGSGLGAQVVSAAPGVELSHATVRVEAGEWVLRDHSRSGIWADGRPVTTLRIDGPMAVRLGSPDGAVLVLDVEYAAAPETAHADIVERTPRRGRTRRDRVQPQPGRRRRRGRHFRQD